MQRFAESIDEESRERERKEIMEQDNVDIQQEEEDPEFAQVLTDFYVLPHPEAHETIEAPGPALPLQYYDNDDGFWDEYIAMKHKKLEDNPMIVKRPFFKH